MLPQHLSKVGAGWLVLLAGIIPAVTAEKASAAPSNSGVQIVQLAGRLRVEINGQLFTEYYFQDVPRPFCYPLQGPGNLPMTRNWPMKDVPGEDHDHKHHRSMWFTHGSVNGLDFWSEDKDFGKIVHEGFVQVASGADAGVIKTRNQWVAKNGTVVCTDERTLRIYNRPATERLLDFEITIHASNGELTFGDTKEGSMAFRLNETMRLKPNKENTGKPTGHIVNSEGVRDGETWGKRAKWCDYYGPVEGKTVGIAIFDNPANPRYPTWWHVRDYGLFAANPFGQHDFENLKDNKTAGNLVVPAGQSVTFRYRVYMHKGDDQQAGVAARYAEYLKTAAK
jgi:hypothetical protein